VPLYWQAKRLKIWLKTINVIKEMFALFDTVGEHKDYSSQILLFRERSSPKGLTGFTWGDHSRLDEKGGISES